MEGQSACDPTLEAESNAKEPEIEALQDGTLESRPRTSNQQPPATHTYSPATTPLEERGSNDSTPDQALVIEITSNCIQILRGHTHTHFMICCGGGMFASKCETPLLHHVGGVFETGTPPRDERSSTPSSDAYRVTVPKKEKTGLKIIL